MLMAIDGTGEADSRCNEEGAVARVRWRRSLPWKRGWSAPVTERTEDSTARAGA